MAGRPRGTDSASSADPVPDQPRHRGSRRELWRQHRLRPRLPHRARRPVGRRRRGRLRQRRRACSPPGQGRSRRAWPFAAAARAATRRSRPDVPRRVQPPAPATSASATSPRSSTTRTSSSRATPSDWSARYPADEELYRERSPILHAERSACPMMFLQGLDDKVVPPDQAESDGAGLAAQGIPLRTSRSRARTTASARPRTSAARPRRSSRSTARCSASPRRRAPPWSCRGWISGRRSDLLGGRVSPETE